MFFLFVVFSSFTVTAAPDFLRVSLIKLIASPEKYNGKKVAVEGYLHVKLEDSVLYLTKDHADRLIGKEGLWINYSDGITFVPEKEAGLSYFDSKWVTLIGTFEFTGEQEHGHMSSNSGTLNNVSRIVEQRQWYDGASQIER